MVNLGGISRIHISHNSGGLEIDHLQFGGAARCRADFNNDGFLDFFDYDDFVRCFETSDCGNGTADFNQDDFVDFFDYADFVDAFEHGC